MEEEQQPNQENSQAAAGKRVPYLRVIGVIAVLLLAALVVYFLFQIWSLSVSQNDAQPAPAEEPEPEAETTEHTPPSLKERQRQLDALKEKENPYQLSTEERRAQFESLPTR